ncbi:MAG: hypothetical protein ACPGUF_08170, partial [Litorivicinus sp.]
KLQITVPKHFPTQTVVPDKPLDYSSLSSEAFSRPENSDNRRATRLALGESQAIEEINEDLLTS